jgi:hypothetical protein
MLVAAVVVVAAAGILGRDRISVYWIFKRVNKHFGIWRKTQGRISKDS